MANTERISVEEWNKRRMNGILTGKNTLTDKEVKQRKKPNHLEEKLQISCVSWFDNAYPNYAFLLFHPANGGYRTEREAAIFRSMGVRAGIPDLFLLVPRKGYSFLAIEMKYGKGKQTDRQKIMEELIQKKSGGLYLVCKSLDHFIKIITNYLND